MSAEWDQIPLSAGLRVPSTAPGDPDRTARVRIWVPVHLKEAIGARLERDRVSEPDLTASMLLRRALTAYFEPEEAPDGR